MGAHSSKVPDYDCQKVDKEFGRLECYRLYNAVINKSQSDVISLLKNKPDIALYPMSFEIWIDPKQTYKGLPVTCPCADEFETCLPTTSMTIDDMVLELGRCLKTGKCIHVRSHESSVSLGDGATKSYPENDCGGFYWVHLAVIMNKKLLIQEMFTWYLQNDKYSNTWFTLKNKMSVLYLALVHNHTEIMNDIMKLIDQLDTGSVYYIVCGYDLHKSIEIDRLDVFKVLAEKNQLEKADCRKVRELYNLALRSCAHGCLEFIADNYEQILEKNMSTYNRLSSILNDLANAMESGDRKIFYIVMKGYVKLGSKRGQVKAQILGWFIEAVLNHNTRAVKTIVIGLDMHNEQELRSELRRLRYSGYSALKWAEELELTDIASFLSQEHFVALGSAHSPWSAISSTIIIENEHVIENVATLITRGHDVNKASSDLTYSRANVNQCNTQNRVMLNETPFYVALNTRRYDVLVKLLLNGALPVADDRFLYRLVDNTIRAKIFYLLLSCNALKSMPAGDTSLLQYLLIQSTYVNGPSYIKPEVRDLALLLLETFSCFCYEDKRFLLSNDINNVDEEILAKIHNVLYEPRTLADLCRRRLRNHLGLSFQLYINYIKHEGFPPRIIDFIQYRHLVLKYFNEEDIQFVEHSLI
ncbi:Hypothetical predicted protein [Mytilus galloprovincialis]|uniref:SOCS box domain-containing protein n=1 Tax=Mytilus galloprovincialis TaxID=29158 RepID=A0A8B6G066_MYTGA|nr:Hypothetical predicted protein [Mytilus galloprovincialis]